MKKKLIAIAKIALLAFIVGGCTPLLEANYVSETEAVNSLYALKDAYIGDSSKVRAIIDLANNTEYQVETIELQTEQQPFRLTVNFRVENRSDDRYIDDNGLNRMSGIVFALVKNADEIVYRFYDDFSDRANPDSAFFGSYYTRQNLCERMSTDSITPDYIVNSTASIRTFEEYYKTIMAVEGAVHNREFSDAVYEFIGDDWEIVINSSIGTELILDDYAATEVNVISESFSRVLGKYQAAGITAQLVTYDIRNFKTNEYAKCVFIYYTHPDEGLVMIVSELIDDERFEDIKEFVINNQK